MKHVNSSQQAFTECLQCPEQVEGGVPDPWMLDSKHFLHFASLWDSTSPLGRPVFPCTSFKNFFVCQNSLLSALSFFSTLLWLQGNSMFVSCCLGNSVRIQPAWKMTSSFSIDQKKTGHVFSGLEHNMVHTSLHYWLRGADCLFFTSNRAPELTLGLPTVMSRQWL